MRSMRAVAMWLGQVPRDSTSAKNSATAASSGVDKAAMADGKNASQPVLVSFGTKLLLKCLPTMAFSPLDMIISVYEGQLLYIL